MPFMNKYDAKLVQALIGRKAKSRPNRAIQLEPKTTERRKLAADNLVRAINVYAAEEVVGLQASGEYTVAMVADWTLAFCKGVTNEMKRSKRIL